MDEKLHFPGMPNVWWMPIQTRTEMLATGVRSPLGIQVFGDDLDDIEKAAIAVEHAVAKVPGTRSAFAERSTGGFYIDFEVKRDAGRAPRPQRRRTSTWSSLNRSAARTSPRPSKGASATRSPSATRASSATTRSSSAAF